MEASLKEETAFSRGSFRTGFARPSFSGSRGRKRSFLKETGKESKQHPAGNES
jgi:hypothetical protein